MGLIETARKIVLKIAEYKAGHTPIPQGKVGEVAENLTSYQIQEAAKRDDTVDAVIAKNKLAGLPESEQVEGFEYPKGK